MATTAKGTPYVVSTDLVANYPTVSSDLADHIDDNLAYNAVTINAQTGTTYTFALADASEGKLVTASNAAASTYTVPPQSSVTWAAGAVLRILNQGAGTVTIAAGSGVTINGTPLTLAQYRGAAIQRTASNTWTFLPFTGGVGNADFSNAATGTYTSGGINYKYITFTASGTLTVTSAGFADVLVVGGGGGGGRNANFYNSGGGGGGGYLDVSNAYLESGTLTVTVGAGGTGGGAFVPATSGNASRVGSYYGIGGGNGAGGTDQSNSPGDNGGSGGGAGSTGAAGSGVSGQGNNGGAGSSAGNLSGGGGGGAGAAGAAAGTNVGGAGGNGLASSITGSSVTRAGGGGGTGSSTYGAGGSGGGGAAAQVTGTSGTANTGGGGGAASTTAGAGGSGIVIIRVAV